MSALQKLVTETSAKSPPREQTESRKGHVVTKESRKFCVLLLNAPEQSAEMPAERISQERKFLHSTLSSLFDKGEEGITVRTAYRLGRRPSSDERPRPLKIVLATAEQADLLLRRSYRLKGSDLWLLKDLCPEDRVRMRAATQEINRRKASGETDLRIVDFQVVKMRPRVRLEPLTITLREATAS